MKLFFLIAVGVSMDWMKTCKKVTTIGGPLFRDGGFYIETQVGEPRLYQLIQVQCLHEIEII